MLLIVASSRPRDFDTGGDVFGSVELGVVDESGPSDGRSRLLEVGTHDDQEFVAITLSLGHQHLGIFGSDFDVMDRTRTDDDQEPLLVAPVQDVSNALTRFGHQLLGVVRNLNLKLGWSLQGGDFLDVGVVDRG